MEKHASLTNNSAIATRPLNGIIPSPRDKFLLRIEELKKQETTDRARQERLDEEQRWRFELDSFANMFVFSLFKSAFRIGVKYITELTDEEIRKCELETVEVIKKRLRFHYLILRACIPLFGWFQILEYCGHLRRRKRLEARYGENFLPIDLIRKKAE